MHSYDQASTGKPLRILIVEDEMLVALMLEQMLTELGHEVVGTAANLHQALEMAGNMAFGFAILDLNIGGQDGYPVADVLTGRGIAFAFATGYRKERIREAYQGTPVLSKPIEQGRLKKLLDQVIAAGNLG